VGRFRISEIAPHSGGKRIPEALKPRLEARIRRYAVEHFAGRYTRIESRFRGQVWYKLSGTRNSPFRSSGRLRLVVGQDEKAATIQRS
jgi:hypothetical protein